MSCFARSRFSFHSLSLWIIVLLIVFVATGLTRSRASRSLTISPASEFTDLAEEVTETVTLTSPTLKTWQWNTTWGEKGIFCPDLIVGVPLIEVPDGQVAAGHVHQVHEKSYSVPLITAGSCTQKKAAILRGTVWFDLSDISKKAPSVFVTSAHLYFKRIDYVSKDLSGKDVSTLRYSCDDQLMIATADWLKDGYKEVLVAGADPLDVVCGRDLCRLDVRSTVNNWLKGSEDNFGWVIKGENEVPVSEKTGAGNSVCLTRYGDFSLEVTYKYNKAPTITYVAPEKPIILVSPDITGGRKNVALASNGAIATAKSYTLDDVYPGLHFQPAYAIDGLRHTTSDGGSYWRDEHGLSSWLEVDFGGSKTIGEIDVITFQVPGYEKAADPTEGQIFTSQGAAAFDVQYWTGSAWMTVPGGSLSGNNLVSRKINFTAITTSKIRIVVNASSDGVARIVELEAWGK